MVYRWSTFTRAVVAAVSLVVIGLLIFAIHPMIEPIIIALLLAYVLNPLVKLLMSRARLPHAWAVPIAYFSCLALLIVIPSILAPIAVRQLTGLSTYLAQIENQLETYLANPVTLFNQKIYLGQLLSNFLKMMSESSSPVAENALAVIERTSTSFAWLLVIFVGSYYLLLDGERLIAWLVRQAPAAAQADVVRLLKEIDLIWRAYLRGTLVLMLIVGIVFSIAWMAIGLPGGLALGLLAGVLTVIPDVGPTAAAMLAVVVALFKGSDFLPLSNFWFAVLVFAIYFVLIQIKSIWLRPRIMRYFLSMNEGLIFISIIGSVVLWGILGALVIVPLLATLGVIARYVRCRLLNLEPWPDDFTPLISLQTEPTEEPAQPLHEDSAAPVPSTLSQTITLSQSETN